MKFKIIKEYDRFYVAIDDLGFRECFLKCDYKPDKEGYITTIVKDTQEREGLPKDKVNRSFNPSSYKSKEGEKI